jgi:MoaA/NifB/PqqE/SkfB family radical SAM enzyme
MGCEYCFEQDLAARPLAEIDIPRLLAALERTGKVFRISFTGGGEPFLVPNLGEACLALAQKHYIAFNTNLAERQVRGFLERVEASRVLAIHASCHIEAMMRRGVLERFVENLLLARERGIPAEAVEVAYPPLLPKAEDYRRMFAERGIELKFSAFCGTLDGRTFPADYSDAELIAFGLNRDAMPAFAPNSRGRTVCNAGCTAAVVRSNGDIVPCDMIPRVIGSIYGHIRMRPHPLVCPSPVCTCPLHLYDAGLYQRTLSEDRAHVAMLRAAYAAGDRLNAQGWFQRLKRACGADTR